MRRSLLAIISALAVGTSFALPASAAVKAGSTCTKKGQIAVVGKNKLVCAVSGRKLIWSSKNLPRSTPTPTPKDVFPAWSETATSFEVARAAAAKYDEWRRSLNKHSVPHESYVDPVLDGSWVRAFRTADVEAAFTLDRFIGRGTLSIMGSNCEWVEATIEQYLEPSVKARGRNRCNNLYSVVLNSFNLSAFSTRGVSGASGAARRDAITGFIHEYTHNVQNTLMGGGARHYSESPAPSWLLEGSANFFAHAIWIKSFNLEDDLTAEFWDNIRGVNTQYLNPLSDYESKIRDRVGNYLLPPGHIGQIATVYIAASVGPQGVLNIFENIGKGMSWPRAFENATGISLDEFYLKFERIRPTFGMRKATMRLVDGVNTPIP